MKYREKPTAIIVGGVLTLIMLLIFMGIPLFNGVMLAFSDLNLREADNPWGGKIVGFDNFMAIFRNKDFIEALLNTLKINLVYILLLTVFAVFLAESLIRLDKGVQKFFVTFFLVPAFIPSMVIAHAASLLLPETAASGRFPWGAAIYAAVMTVKTAGIPLLFILESWQQDTGESPWGGLKRWAVSVVFVLIQLSAILTIDPDVLKNIPGFSAGVSLLDFIMAGEMGPAGPSQAAWLVQVSVQLILGIVAYFLLKAIFGSRKAWVYTYKYPDKSPLGFILPVLYTLFLAWFLYRPLLVGGARGLSAGLALLPDRNYMVFLKHTALLALVSLAGVPVSVLLARCFAGEGFLGGLTRALLILFVLTGNIGLHQYLFYKSLGLLNTWYGYAAHSFFPLMNSIVLAFILRRRIEPYGAEIWKPAFGLGMLHFISMWNSPYISITFSKTREGYTPAAFIESMARVRLIQAGAENAGQLDPREIILGLDLLLALVPVFLFLVFRRLLANSVLMSYARVKG